jgi:hypothetical protein
MSASRPAKPSRKKSSLFWSRYITEGKNSEREFDLRRFFEDAEFVAIKLACLASLIVILCLVVAAHVH